MLTLSIMLAEKKKPAAKIFDESDLGWPLWKKVCPWSGVFPQAKGWWQLSRPQVQFFPIQTYRYLF